MAHRPVQGQERTVVQGTLLIDPDRLPEPGWIEIESGRIARVEFGDTPSLNGEQVVGGRDRLICPAFFDAHFHIPQIDSIGCDGLHLLEWLAQVIFPAEMWFGKAAAVPLTRRAVRDLTREGTVGVAAYLTSHAQASHAAVNVLQTESSLRYIVGRSAMDRNAPDELTAEDRDRARRAPITNPVAGSEGKGDERRRISVNPRFAVACTEELLAELGWWVKDHPGTDVQTHLAETSEECRLIAGLFPEDENYTSVYDRFGLLTDRTLLAHCIYLSDAEWSLIRKRGSIVVHCPTANVFLSSGLFDLDAARRHEVPLALGSDVGGGPDIAMPRVARAMIEMAKVRRLTRSDPKRVYVPSPAEVWNLITRRNAELLGWSDSGRIEVGAAADLLVLRVPETWLDEHLIGRLLYNWSSRLIEDRIFSGRLLATA